MKLSPTVSSVFASSKRLRQLKEQTDRLRKLDDRFKRHLKPPLSEHATLATISDGCLVVHIDGPAWAARLRYKIPEILAALKEDKHFEPVRSIRIRSLSKECAPTPVPRRHYADLNSVSDLKAATDTIANVEVRNALLRLAERFKAQ
jgi:hypothetical protein